jgi:hypothetical protein
MNPAIIAIRFVRFAALVATALVAGAALAQSQAASAQPQAASTDVGRLFYTPQQRAELDYKRATNAVETEVVVDRLVTVNGRVSRSSGKTTTWINGVPQYDAYKGRDPSRVAIDDNGADVTVKVGDTLDRNRGEVRPALEPGDIEIERGKGGAQAATH